MVAKDATSLKRLSYITRRVRLLQELEKCGVVDTRSVPGTDNPSDPLTKCLDKINFRRYMARLYNVPLSRITG